MLDPRLQYTQVQARQRELAEQAARDRLAASLHTERHALGRLLTAAGAALLALGTRLHGKPAPAPSHLIDDAKQADGGLSEAGGHGAEWIVVRRQDSSAAATSARVERNRYPTSSKECS